MFALGIKGPVPINALRRFANDLGGALFAPFEQTAKGNWVAPINDHFQDRAFAVANKHGLVVLGVRHSRGSGGYGSTSYRNGFPDPSLHVLGSVVGKQSAYAPLSAITEKRSFGKVQFSMGASDAITRAASSAPNTTLNTLHLFLALEDADLSGQWERLWLETGDRRHLASLNKEDPEPEADGTWEDLPLSKSCCNALETSIKISSKYDLGLVPTGVLALGLIADYESAASRALTAQGMSRLALLQSIQEIALGISLGRINEFMAEVLAALRSSEQQQRPLMPDDGGLRHFVAATWNAERNGSLLYTRAACGRIWISEAVQSSESSGRDFCPDCRTFVLSLPERLDAEIEENYWTPFMITIEMPVVDGHIRVPY